MSDLSDSDYSAFIRSIPPKARSRLHNQSFCLHSGIFAVVLIIAPTFLVAIVGAIVAVNFVEIKFRDEAIIASVLLGMVTSGLLISRVVRWAKHRDIVRYLNGIDGDCLPTCPNCEYDQSGTAGIECPECGCRVQFR